MNVNSVGALLLAYCIGAIPIGYIIARLKGVADIRKLGSGNIGATNIARVLGLPYFFLVFFLDAGKAFLFIYLIGNYFALSHLYYCAGVLLLGNGISPFLYGSGGKGVATLFGILAALYPMATLMLLIKWLCVLLVVHTVGVASVVAAWSLPLYGYMLYGYDAFLFFLFCALWITVTHRANISTYWRNRWLTK